MGCGRGHLINSDIRKETIRLVEEAFQTGARKQQACELVGVSVRTLERWEKPNGTQDKRKHAARVPGNKLTQEERHMILGTVNMPAYQDLPPCKIVPMLADTGVYIGSESTIYRILRAENQLCHR